MARKFRIPKYKKIFFEKNIIIIFIIIFIIIIIIIVIVVIIVIIIINIIIINIIMLPPFLASFEIQKHYKPALFDKYFT